MAKAPPRPAFAIARFVAAISVLSCAGWFLLSEATPQSTPEDQRVVVVVRQSPDAIPQNAPPADTFTGGPLDSIVRWWFVDWIDDATKNAVENLGQFYRDNNLHEADKFERDLEKVRLEAKARNEKTAQQALKTARQALNPVSFLLDKPAPIPQSAPSANGVTTDARNLPSEICVQKVWRTGFMTTGDPQMGAQLGEKLAAWQPISCDQKDGIIRRVGFTPQAIAECETNAEQNYIKRKRKDADSYKIYLESKNSCRNKTIVLDGRKGIIIDRKPDDGIISITRNS
jgi:hypothetical protein